MNKPNIFNSVLAQRPGRNNFDLSHDLKMSFNMGTLVPTALIECVPGDAFNIQQQNLLRFAPLVSPVMHRVDVKCYWFFVPNRLLWPNWEDFISPKDTDDNDIVPPTLDYPSTAVPEGSLADYLGIPTGTLFNLSPSAMPFAAYCLIWDEWFRDQNLQTEKFVELTDGDNYANYSAIANGVPAKIAWGHDYFTSALPWAQKGDAVTIPLVQNDAIPIVGTSGTFAQMVQRRSADGTFYAAAGSVDTNASGNLINSNGPLGVFLDPNGTLGVTDLQSTAATIETLRSTFRLQEFLERDAVGGTRYIETIYNHFGVTSSDSRLNRPEVIGMFKGNMVISEVLQTSESGSGATDTPQGNMAGHGISVNGGRGMNYYCEEHGWIIGLMAVTPKTAYQDGLARKWTRTSRLDYFWPSFQHIGEQEILNQEVLWNHSDPSGTFGYTPRYAEYKYEQSRVAGEMRTSLAYWHLGRIFESGANEPDLNSDFIEADPRTDIFAVLDPNITDNIYAHVIHNIRASRLMAFYGRPLM